MTTRELPALPEWMDSYSIPCDAFDGGDEVRLSDRMRAYGELCRAAPAGGDDLDMLLALVPRPAKAHHKMDDAEEREIKRVNRFRDRVIENIRAHCASRPVSAPAGSGEVENLASRLVTMSNGLHSAHLCTDLRRAAALLRKLQQGAGERLRAVDTDMTPNQQTSADKPVAWRYRDKTRSVVSWNFAKAMPSDYSRDDWEVQPLYTNPQGGVTNG